MSHLEKPVGEVHIHNRESESVRSLVPYQLRSTAETLIALLEDYYAYLNQKGQATNLIDRIQFEHDVDYVGDEYLQAIKDEIAKNIPNSSVIDNRKLLRKIIDYYYTRGSDRSAETFFRIFFDDTITLTYPRERLFKSSDSKIVDYGFISNGTRYSFDPISELFFKANEFSIIISDAPAPREDVNGVYIRGDDVTGRPAYYFNEYVIANLTGNFYALYNENSLIPDADNEIWTLGPDGIGPVTDGLLGEPYPTVTKTYDIPYVGPPTSGPNVDSQELSAEGVLVITGDLEAILFDHDYDPNESPALDRHLAIEVELVDNTLDCYVFSDGLSVNSVVDAPNDIYPIALTDATLSNLIINYSTIEYANEFHLATYTPGKRVYEKSIDTGEIRVFQERQDTPHAQTYTLSNVKNRHIYYAEDGRMSLIAADAINRTIPLKAAGKYFGYACSDASLAIFTFYALEDTTIEFYFVNGYTDDAEYDLSRNASPSYFVEERSVKAGEIVNFFAPTDFPQYMVLFKSSGLVVGSVYGKLTWNSNDESSDPARFNNIMTPMSNDYVNFTRTVNFISQLGDDIDGEAAGDQSGYSVSMNATGNRVAIGAILNDGNGDGSGHTRIYEWNGSSWTQLGQDIDGEVGGLFAGDQSGISVSMNSAGDRIAIGATGNDGGGFNSGHTRIYEYNTNTTSWVKLGQDIDGEAAGDQSGNSVSINAEGNRVAIGARYNSGYRGHTRIYEYNTNTSSWTQLGQDIDGEAAYDQSGYSVSMNAAGNRVAIGAPYNDGNGTNSGHTQIYEWDGTNWVQLGFDIDGEEGQGWSLDGFSVSMNSAGDRVAIGARLNNNVNGIDAGHVRVYQIENKYRLKYNPTSEIAIGNRGLYNFNRITDADNLSSVLLTFGEDSNQSLGIPVNQCKDTYIIGHEINNAYQIVNLYEGNIIRSFYWDTDDWVQYESHELAINASAFETSLPARSFWKFEGTYPFALQAYDNVSDESLELLGDLDPQYGFNRNEYNVPNYSLYSRYDTKNGFVSDVNKLHDGEYWQEFSYVIRTGISYDQWEIAYKKLVHPAGLRLFNELIIESKGGDIRTKEKTFSIETDEWVSNLILPIGSHSPLFQPGWLDVISSALEYLGIFVEVQSNVFDQENVTTELLSTYQLTYDKLISGLTNIELETTYVFTQTPFTVNDGTIAANEVASGSFDTRAGVNPAISVSQTIPFLSWYATIQPFATITFVNYQPLDISTSDIANIELVLDTPITPATDYRGEPLTDVTFPPENVVIVT